MLARQTPLSEERPSEEFCDESAAHYIGRVEGARKDVRMTSLYLGEHQDLEMQSSRHKALVT